MAHNQPDGYLASPPTGRGPGVLVLHAWWGLNDTMKAVCDRLAEAGFVAFAPDLYQGEVADTIPAAEALAGALFQRVEGAKAEVAAAAAFLADRAGGADRGLAVIGFSLGASYALRLSNAAPEHIRRVVLFYGSGPDEFGDSQAAYLGHFGTEDDFEPLESVAHLADALHGAGRPVTIYTYEGTGHWFAEPDRPDAYDEAAAELAWERTLAFLRGSA